MSAYSCEACSAYPTSLPDGCVYIPLGPGGVTYYHAGLCPCGETRPAITLRQDCAECMVARVRDVVRLATQAPGVAFASGPVRVVASITIEGYSPEAAADVVRRALEVDIEDHADPDDGPPVRDEDVSEP